ncbi:MAG: ABC transporter permease subunit [Coprococcus sp.]
MPSGFLFSATSGKISVTMLFCGWRGLTAIPDTLYEAARADGANNIQCFRYITMPNLMSTLYTITVLAFFEFFQGVQGGLSGGGGLSS